MGGVDGMDGLASLFGSSGSSDGAESGGLLGMLGAGSKGDADPLEALLRSPLLMQGAGKGGARALGLLSNALTVRRRTKQIYRRLKPWLPLAFVLLLLFTRR